MKLLFKSAGAEHVAHESLSAYADGELRGRRKQTVALHISACERCSGDLEGIRETVALLRDLPVLASMRSLAVPRTMSPRRSWWPTVRPIPVSAVAVVALAFVMTGVFSGILNSGNPQAPVQVGMQEPAPIVSTGSVLTPERAVPLDVSASESAAAAPSRGIARLWWAIGSAALVSAVAVIVVIGRRQRSFR